MEPQFPYNALTTPLSSPQPPHQLHQYHTRNKKQT